MYFSLIIFAIIIYCSFHIASQSQSEESRSDPTSYWFAGNNLILSILSNVGSIFSVALICTMMAVAFKTGLFSILFFVSGTLIVALFFLLLLRHRGVTRFFFGRTRRPRPVALTEYFAHVIGQPAAVLLTFVFIIWMLLGASIELSVSRLLFAHLFPRDFILPKVLTFALIAICAAYVSIGGFLGVLRTDRFQFYIICVAALIISAFIIHALAFEGIGSKEILPLIDFSALPLASEDMSQLAQDLGQAAILIFAVAMFLPTTMDFWVRNFGTLTSRRRSRKSVLWSCVLVLPFVLVILIIGVFAREAYGWSTELEKPFYHIAALIDIVIARGGNIEGTSSPLFAGIWSQALLPATVAMLSVVMLTTLSTVLLTSGQLFVIARDRLGLTRFTNVNGSTFVLLAALAIGSHSAMSGDYVFAGWGTVWASSFLMLASVVLSLLVLPPRLTPLGAAICVALTVAILIAIMAIGYYRYYLQFLQMDSLLSAGYILAWPASCALVWACERWVVRSGGSGHGKEA